MKRLAATLISALSMVSAAFAPPAPTVQNGPAPGEHRMSANEIRELARREMAWCDTFHETTGDCQMVALVRLLPDGRIGQTTTWIIDDKPRVQVFIADADRFDGDRICSVVDTRRMPMAFTIDGNPASDDLLPTLKAYMVENFAPLQGKRVCQAFYRDAKGDRVREEITVDGKRRPDLESGYVLREGDDGFALRSDSAAGAAHGLHT